MSDVRVRQFEERSDRAIIFVVDASGSAALARLAEAKGAIELLLGEAYARRDHVALVAFRGDGADILLPPTRSLVQTKRRLGQLAGRGRHAAGLGAEGGAGTCGLAQGKGMTPSIALLTDGRANVDLSGIANRAQAAEDAKLMARAIRAKGLQRAGDRHRPQAHARPRRAGPRDGRALPAPPARRRARRVLRRRRGAGRWHDPALPPEDWPLRSASRAVASAPHRWHVQVTGTGPDVLLLHGAGASAHTWHRLIPYLDDRYRLIAPDLPGHGFTQSPRGRSGLPQVARDIAALMQTMEAAPRIIIGHSAGGASRARDRAAGPVWSSTGSS
jgi:hypothetical protein